MTRQDHGVREPRVRLRVVLVLLRILAGRRGHALVSWRGAGFTYALLATRTPSADPTLIEIDDDPANDDPDVPLHRARLVELLTVQP